MTYLFVIFVLKIFTITDYSLMDRIYIYNKAGCIRDNAYIVLDLLY